MADASGAVLAGHTADWDGEALIVACSCHTRHPDGYFAHIAALLGTDEAGARQGLLEAHANVEVNTGMCGGCDTCGAESTSVACPICGSDYEPCLTYYEASGRGPSAGSTIEGHP